MLPPPQSLPARSSGSSVIRRASETFSSALAVGLKKRNSVASTVSPAEITTIFSNAACAVENLRFRPSDRFRIGGAVRNPPRMTPEAGAMAVAGSASYEAAAAQPNWRRLASPTRAGRSYGGKGKWSAVQVRRVSEYGTPQKPPQTLCAGSAFN
jgi:hypothetical protein